MKSEPTKSKKRTDKSAPSGPRRKPSSARTSREAKAKPKPAPEVFLPAADPSPAKPVPKTKRATATKARAPRSKLKIPAVLLEGDPPSTPASGPGSRYALGPAPAQKHGTPASRPGELPESYGTQRLFLTARDPHWLYASWDLTPAQLKSYNALSVHGHLIIRTYLDSVAGEPLVETPVHPESRSWFVHAGRGGTRYVAELGYRGNEGLWHTIAVSAATMTPTDRLSDDLSLQLATLPSEVKFEQVVEAVREVVTENVPLIEAIQQLREEGHTALPRISVTAQHREDPSWTPAQTEALAKVVAMDSYRRVWIGSMEITELIRRHLQSGVSSLTVSQITGISSGQFAKPISSASGAVSGAADKPHGFWMNVNAELIIYGATERTATLTIGGRAVRLRTDGTFSFRFALPDGDYNLPVVATSPDGTESRSAQLSFQRATQTQGEVTAHPQDPGLRIPSSENVS